MVFKAIWKPLALISLVANQQWQARWSQRDSADASERAAVRRRCVSLRINGRKISSGWLQMLKDSCNWRGLMLTVPVIRRQ